MQFDSMYEVDLQWVTNSIKDRPIFRTDLRIRTMLGFPLAHP